METKPLLPPFHQQRRRSLGVIHTLKCAPILFLIAVGLLWMSASHYHVLSQVETLPVELKKLPDGSDPLEGIETIVRNLPEMAKVPKLKVKEEKAKEERMKEDTTKTPAKEIRSPTTITAEPLSLQQEQSNKDGMDVAVLEKKYDFDRKTDFRVANAQQYFYPERAQESLQLEKSGKGKNVISMALYGSGEPYTLGAIENALLVKRDWNGWVLRIYHDDSVPEWCLTMLRELQVELIKAEYATEQRDHAGLFWRFYVLMDKEVTRFIIRDPDSRISYRDRAAVQAWVESGELFHGIRDHPHHGIEIMGAMWGALGGLIDGGLIEEYRRLKQATPFNEDQLFLREYVWPFVKKHALVHDSYFCQREDLWSKVRRPMPVQRLSEYDFVGNALTPKTNYLGLKLLEKCPEACRGDPSWDWC